MIRRAIYYSGHVQGVGFRYTTVGVARGFDVTGYVKNLPDGRVEAIVEGKGADVDRFQEAVVEALGGHIHDTACQESPATGEFGAFDIRF